MQLHAVTNHKGRWQFNFAVNNLEERSMSKTYRSLVTSEIEPRGALISRVMTYNRTKDDMLAGVRFYCGDEKILEAG